MSFLNIKQDATQWANLINAINNGGGGGGGGGGGVNITVTKVLDYKQAKSSDKLVYDLDTELSNFSDNAFLIGVLIDPYADAPFIAFCGTVGMLNTYNAVRGSTEVSYYNTPQDAYLQIDKVSDTSVKIMYRNGYSTNIYCDLYVYDIR